MNTIQYIEAAGKTRREAGRVYGAAAREKIERGIEDYKRLLPSAWGVSWDEIRRMAMVCLPGIEKDMKDEISEAEGIAEGSGAAFEDIMVLNTRYELTKMPKPHECTTAAVLPAASRDGHVFMIKNWDYRVGIMDNTVILRLSVEGEGDILGICEAGQLIRDGINTRGFGIVSNNLQSVNDSLGEGVPTCFMRRRVLSSKTLEDAKAYIASFPRSVSGNTMMVSKDGRAFDFEIHPGGTDVIGPEGDLLTHANHFIVHPDLQFLPKSPRDARLRELLEAKKGSIDAEYIKLCMADHANYPQAICRHPADPKLPLAKRSITVACEIYDLTEGSAQFCYGPPCTGEFITYKL